MLRKPLGAKSRKASLAYISIKDFKSYAGTHVLGPLSEGMNAILGPNGSGKSNLMDAICFVLGVETKHLRGARMADLGYRRESAREPFRKAEVSLKLKIVTSDKSGKETETAQEFCRRVTGEKSSQWIVDGQIIDRNQYHKILSHHNILPRVLNCVVSQGRVESLTLMSEKEKGMLIDEVSGSNLLKPEYDKLTQEIQVLTLDLRRVNAQKRMVEDERRTYKRQYDELLNYEKEVQKAQELEATSYLFKLYCNEWFGQAARDRVKAAEEEALSKQTKLSALQLRKKELLKDQSDRQNKVTAATATAERLRIEKAAKESASEDLKRNEALTQQRLRLAEDEIRNREKELEKIYAEYRQIGTTWLSMSAKWEDKQNSLKAKLADNHFHTADSKERSEYLEIKALADATTTEMNKTLKEIEHQLLTQQTTLRTIADDRGLRRRELEQMEAETAELQSCLTSGSAELDKISGKVLSAEQSEVDQGALVMKKEQLSEAKREYNDARRLLETFGSYRREDHAERRKREIIDRLKREIPGLYGRVTDLCDLVNKEYATAVSSALGQQGDSIIIDTFQHAQMAIQFLKRERLAHQEFLPVDNMKSKPRDSRLSGHSDLFLPAIDCISFDTEMTNVFHSILEDTVIVSGGLDKARKVAFRDAKRLGLSVRVIALDGQRIAKNTNMSLSATGGAGHNDAERFQQRAREQAEADLKRLPPIISALESDIKQLDSIHSAHEDNLQKLRSKMASLQSDLQIARGRLETRTEGCADIRKELSRMSSEEEAIRLEMAGLERQRESTEALRDKRSKDFFSTSSLKKMRVAEKDFLKLKSAFDLAMKEHQHEEDHLKSDLARVLRALDCPVETLDAPLLEQMNIIEKELEDSTQTKEATERVAKLHKELAVLLKKTADAAAEVEAQRTRMAGITADIDSANAEIRALTETVKEVSQSVQTLEEEIYQLGMRLASAGQIAEQYDQAGRELLLEIAIKSIPLPVKNGTLEELQTLLMDNDSQVESNVEPDFSRLPEAYRELRDEEHGEKLKKSLLDSWSSQLEKLKMYKPNHQSRDKLESTKLKCAEIATRHAQISSEKHHKSVQLAKCRDLRAEKFRKCFEHTRDNLKEIYNELTRGNWNEMDGMPVDEVGRSLWLQHFEKGCGGQAFLELEEDVCADPFNKGIIFNAIPPDKRYTHIEALSGGEKTMAALALLFAIQSFRRSPFIVLDEIDAALDSQNVEALRNYLKSTPSQIIIVSLKEEMYCHVDSVIGVYKDHETESSGILTCNIAQYPQAFDVV